LGEGLLSSSKRVSSQKKKKKEDPHLPIASRWAPPSPASGRGVPGASPIETPIAEVRRNFAGPVVVGRDVMEV
jgi:hypothetical protein